ncbi:Acetylgalactosaminyl-O-glycosyl-glycoprotein beta-1,3-N-acetylglucosaminyltransferase [Merluccius polli]|uniref:Hexosyltransferase n=1 Tax=Merluccius polli TaxID=89951 RepID=A0AA47MRR1_MERPO|nr:Acetylgalactosaminyl-O-glycosyl-glycoprotein beta-1,3-N-acetylglucosaminyltransferase [Merluccius polli]
MIDVRSLMQLSACFQISLSLPIGHVYLHISTLCEALWLWLSRMLLRRKTGFFLMVTICLLLISIWKNYHIPPPPFNGAQLPPEPIPSREKPAAIISRPSLLISPRCEQNLSMANVSGFFDLPTRLQDFMYYQHCKHFPLLLDLPNKCGGADGSSDVFLLLAIKSPPQNFERRQVLRDTWAQERPHKGVWIRRVFMSGTSGAGIAKRRLNKLMAVEHKKHGDILQWDFQESFTNLTLKQVLFLEWVKECCPRVRFLLNGDDDIFAHTDNMVDYLQGVHGNDGGDKHLFTGALMEGTGPVRENNKYFVPVQVQASDSYPAYCSGGGYMLSGHTANVLYRMSRFVALHPIDDAYMGMCLDRAGLKPSAHMGVKPWGLNIPLVKEDTFDPCFYKDILMVHRFMPAQMYLLWDQVNDPKLRCWSDGTA